MRNSPILFAIGIGIFLATLDCQASTVGRKFLGDNITQDSQASTASRKFPPDNITQDSQGWTINRKFLLDNITQDSQVSTFGRKFPSDNITLDTIGLHIAESIGIFINDTNGVLSPLGVHEVSKPFVVLNSTDSDRDPVDESNTTRIIYPVPSLGNNTFVQFEAKDSVLESLDPDGKKHVITIMVAPPSIKRKNSNGSSNDTHESGSGNGSGNGSGKEDETGAAAVDTLIVDDAVIGKFF